MVWQWRSLPSTVWTVELGWARTGLWGGYASGGAVLVFSSFMLGQFELFGLRQVMRPTRAMPAPTLCEPLIYRFDRHPLMLGFLIAFRSTPDMSAGRMLFGTGATGYILPGVRFEEDDLRRELGRPYERYMEGVPRFVPGLPAGRTMRSSPTSRAGPRRRTPKPTSVKRRERHPR